MQAGPPSRWRTPSTRYLTEPLAWISAGPSVRCRRPWRNHSSRPLGNTRAGPPALCSLPSPSRHSRVPSAAIVLSVLAMPSAYPGKRNRRRLARRASEPRRSARSLRPKARSRCSRRADLALDVIEILHGDVVFVGTTGTDDGRLPHAAHRGRDGGRTIQRSRIAAISQVSSGTAPTMRSGHLIGTREAVDGEPGTDPGRKVPGPE